MIKVKRYTASWCQPCKVLAPVFLELQSQFPQVLFETIDVDLNKNTAISEGVTSVPTVIVENGGQIIQKIVGVKPKMMYINTINSLI